MALEMQFIPLMKSVVGAFLSLVLASGLTAAAEESACVKSFRKADAEFQKEYSNIEQRKSEAEIGSIVGGAVGVGCVLVRRTVMGAVGCSLVGGAAGGAAFAYSRTLAAKLQRLYDSYRLFQAYTAYQEGTAAESDSAKQLVADLGGESAETEMILKEVSTLMEWGSLCEGEQPRSYDEILDMLSGRLQGL